MNMRKNSPQAFKSFEAFWANARMQAKMFCYLLFFIAIVQLALNLANFILLPEAGQGTKLLYFKSLMAYAIYEVPILNAAKFFQIYQQEVDARMFLYSYQRVFFYYNAHIQHYFNQSCYAWLLLPVSYFAFWWRSRRTFNDKHLRGTIIISDKAFGRKIKKKSPNILLNQKISIPFACENRHFLIIGKPGSGKTQLNCRGIEKVIERNEKAIIYDFKGDYVAKFFNPATDILFNPVDTRTVKWSLFNEIDSEIDIEAIVASLIPPAKRTDDFWDNAARDVLYAIFIYCLINNKKTNEDLYQMSILPRKILIEKFKEFTGMERGVAPLEEEKTGNSVISTLSQYIKVFAYIRHTDGDFSISKWTAKTLTANNSGRIFISNYMKLSTILRPILSLFIDIFACNVLMLPEDLNRRIFFFLDEFGTLQKLQNITNLLKLSRSFGCSLWLGIQDNGQLESIYGQDLCQTIINSCGNTFIFALDDHRTAKAMSDKISDREVRRANENFSYGVHDFKDGHSLSQQEKIEKAVLPSEIMTLGDLEFYLKLATFPEYCKTKLTYRQYLATHPSFIEQKNITQYILQSQQTDDLKHVELTPSQTEMEKTTTEKEQTHDEETPPPLV